MLLSQDGALARAEFFPFAPAPCVCCGCFVPDSLRERTYWHVYGNRSEWNRPIAPFCCFTMEICIVDMISVYYFDKPPHRSGPCPCPCCCCIPLACCGSPVMFVSKPKCCCCIDLRRCCGAQNPITARAHMHTLVTSLHACAQVRPSWLHRSTATAVRRTSAAVPRATRNVRFHA